MKTRRKYRDYFDAEQVCTARAIDAVRRNAEKRIADLIFNATTWTGSTLTTGITHEWDDAANATPIVDVNAARKKVWELTGMWPNALVINRNVFNNLRTLDEIKEAIQGAAPVFRPRPRHHGPAIGRSVRPRSHPRRRRREKHRQRGAGPADLFHLE